MYARVMWGAGFWPASVAAKGNRREGHGWDMEGGENGWESENACQLAGWGDGCLLAAHWLGALMGASAQAWGVGAGNRAP